MANSALILQGLVCTAQPGCCGLWSRNTRCHEISWLEELVEQQCPRQHVATDLRKLSSQEISW